MKQKKMEITGMADLHLLLRLIQFSEPITRQIPWYNLP